MTGFRHDYYYVLVYQVVTISILKCAIIAGKYASFSHEQIDQLCSRYMTVAELDTEHMLASWADQSPAQIFKSIDMAMKKSQFDESNFFLTFIKEPRHDTILALQ